MCEGRHYFDASGALLDHVQRAFTAPGILLQTPGTLRVEAHFSSPRPDAGVYGLAHAAGVPSSPIRPWMEELLVTGIWRDGGGEGAGKDPGEGAGKDPGKGVGKDPGEDDGGDNGGTGTLIYALSCYIYTLPQHRAGLVYVSKLDTTGYAPAALAGPRAEVCAAWGRKGTTIAKLLTESVLGHFAEMGHWAMPGAPSKQAFAVDHVSLHVLARAQHAYLFPWSDRAPGKHVLSDKALIRWWRGVLTRVLPARGDGSLDAGRARDCNDDRNGGLDVRAFYLVPGFSALEAAAEVVPAATEREWMYGEPYTRAWPGQDGLGNPLPLYHPGLGAALVPPDRSGRRADPGDVGELAGMQPSIAALVPTFEDDPKGRFLAELVEEAYEGAGAIKVAGGRRRKRRAPVDPAPAPTPAPTEHTETKKARLAFNTNEDQARLAPGERGQAAPCRRGHEHEQEHEHEHEHEQGHGHGHEQVPAPRDAGGPEVGACAVATPLTLTLAQREAWRERAQLDRVSPSEFWERMGFRQECNSGNAVGVFVLLVQKHANTPPATPGRPDSPVGDGAWRTALGALPGKTLHELVIRLLLLDKNDWSSASQAAELTRRWVRTVGAMVRRKGEAPRSMRFRGPGDGVPATDTTANAAATCTAEAEADLEARTFAFIALAPPPADVVSRGEKVASETRAKAAAVARDDTQLAATAAGPAPHMLTVKRRRKPAPAS